MALEAFSLVGRIALEGADKVTKQLKGVDNQLEETGNSSQKTGGKFSQFGTVMQGVLGAEALQAVGRWGKAVLSFGIQSNASMETYRNTLAVVLKDQKKANEYLKWATEFAKKTPFETAEIVEATVKLKSYGIEAKNSLGTIGDMASVMGKPLMQAVEAVADAQTGELERLKEFGITKQELIDKSDEYYGKVFTNAKGQIVDQELMNKTLFRVMNERYKGGMAIQSKTFSGMLSNFKDSMTAFAQVLSKPLFDALKPSLEWLNGQLSKLMDWFTGLSPNTQMFIATVAGLTIAFTALVAIFAPMLVMLPLMVEGFTLFAGSIGMTAGSLVLLTGGLILLIPLIIALAVLIVKNWDKIKEKGKELWEGMKQIWDNIKAKIQAFGNWLMSFPIIKKFVDTAKSNFEALKKAVKIMGDMIKAIFSAIGSAIKSKTEPALNWISNKFKAVKDSISNFMDSAWKKVSDITSKIAGAFRKLILKIPMPKLPHLKITTGHKNFLGKDIPYPKFDIDWYAKGGYFDQAQLFGAGEKGREVLMPLEHRKNMQPFSKAIAENLKDILGGMGFGGSLEVPLIVNGREFARAVVSDMDKALAKRGTLQGGLLNRGNL